MKREDLLLLLFALALLAAMLLTIFSGGGRSRHGYGAGLGWPGLGGGLFAEGNALRLTQVKASPFFFA